MVKLSEIEEEEERGRVGITVRHCASYFQIHQTKQRHRERFCNFSQIQEQCKSLCVLFVLRMCLFCELWICFVIYFGWGFCFSPFLRILWTNTFQNGTVLVGNGGPFLSAHFLTSYDVIWFESLSPVYLIFALLLYVNFLFF